MLHDVIAWAGCVCGVAERRDYLPEGRHLRQDNSEDLVEPEGPVRRLPHARERRVEEHDRDKCRGQSIEASRRRRHAWGLRDSEGPCEACRVVRPGTHPS